MLGSPISLQASPLESLLMPHRSLIGFERRDDDAQLQNHISSLYEPDPFPGINFNHDPSNRWESIAKEILTPFAPKYPIYNYKKFLPTRYQSLQSLVSPLMSPTSTLFENRNHFTNKPRRRKVSFRDNPVYGREFTERDYDPMSFKRFLSGNQTARHDFFQQGGEPEEVKKVGMLKKYLTEQEPAQKNTFLDMRQIQSRGKSRPQTAAESLRKNQARTLFIEANGNTVGNFSDEGSRADSSDSTVEGDNRKDNSTTGKLVPHPKVLAAIKATREPGKLARQRSRRSLLVTDKPFIGRSSFQKDEKSRESSVRNDSKFSIMVKKVSDEEVKKNKKQHRRTNLRRKSDTSNYSGGECLKLTRHMDIILPSDIIKKVLPVEVSPVRSEKRQGTMVGLINKAKKKGDTDKKKEFRSCQPSPQNMPVAGIPFLETINSMQVLRPMELDPKTPGEDHLMNKKTLELTIKTKSASIGNQRPPQIRAITPLTSVTPQHKIIMFNVSDLRSVKSKTPSSTSRENIQPRPETTMNDKTPGSYTERNVRHGKKAFEKRLKNGDLSEALKAVLDLNLKAQKTVFRKKTPELIKTSRPTSRPVSNVSKKSNKSGSKGDLDKDRSSSPYTKPMGLRKLDMKASISSQGFESIKEQAKKKVRRKKIVFQSTRSKSAPKINELPQLEKIYLF